MPYRMQLFKKSKKEVWIAGGEYCTDTRYSDKHRRKETQHEHLQTLLQARGFAVTLLPGILR